MENHIKDFESAIGELETIVKTLEAGDLALEQSLQLFAVSSSRGSATPDSRTRSDGSRSSARTMNGKQRPTR